MSGFTVRFLFVYNIYMTEKTKRYRAQISMLGCLYLAGIIFFMVTNPAELPLLLLVIPFAYIFITLYLSVVLIARLIGVKRALAIAFIISVFGVLILVLGSLHQLTIRDTIISLALTVVLTWYVAKSNSRLTG
jgi:hypothetical protein